jgi:hypothetical protein
MHPEFRVDGQSKGAIGLDRDLAVAPVGASLPEGIDNFDRDARCHHND